MAVTRNVPGWYKVGSVARPVGKYCRNIKDSGGPVYIYIYIPVSISGWFFSSLWIILVLSVMRPYFLI